MENENIDDFSYYIPVKDIVSIELKEAVEGSTTVKPKNGYWVKKTAIPQTSSMKKKVLTFDEFKKQLPPVQSPYATEDDIMYEAKYDKLTDRTQYFKNGRRNSTKITLQKAYDTYLYDEGKKLEKGGGIDDISKIKVHNFSVVTPDSLKKAILSITTDVYNIQNHSISLLRPNMGYANRDKENKFTVKVHIKSGSVFENVSLFEKMLAKKVEQKFIIDKVEKTSEKPVVMQITFGEKNKMEKGGEIELGLIVRFKDIMGDIHVGKIISKNEIKNAFDVVETNTGKEYLVAKSQIID
jgi:hypothetical protein